MGCGTGRVGPVPSSFARPRMGVRAQSDLGRRRAVSSSLEIDEEREGAAVIDAAGLLAARVSRAITPVPATAGTHSSATGAAANRTQALAGVATRNGDYDDFNPKPWKRLLKRASCPPVSSRRCWPPV